MTDNVRSLLDNTSKNIDTLLNSKLDDIGNDSIKYIQEVDKTKKDAQKRFESYYDRKKIIDYMIYINLAVTPILFLIILKLVFFKK